MAAAYRAAECGRPDELFHDPLAARLAGERGRRIVARLPEKAFIGGWSVVIRTRVIDEQIGAAIAEGADRVLNLGAGLDTRPYRMELPDALRWIEIDQPHVIAFKERSLAGEIPRCRLERIGLDLSDARARSTVLEQATAGAGNVLVLTEAVIPYLAGDAVASLAADLRAIPVIRQWIVDYFSPEAYAYRRRSGMTRAMENAPFRFEPKDYFGFFTGLGWRPKDVRYLAIEADRWNRPPAFPASVRWTTRLMRLFLSAERRAAMKKHTGYVLFEPDEGGSPLSRTI